MRGAWMLGLIVSAGVVPARAGATYSIAAADTATGEVGGAGTSCVGAALSVSVIYGVSPGHGVVQAQAQLNLAGRDRAVELLALDTPPADIIAEITSPAFDSIARRRQYGIVDLAGRAAAHTGSQNGVFAGDRQGATGAFVYTVQGNILTGRAVLDQAAAAFEGGGCDLAERLMRALEAGADNGEGDSRCTPDGIPSDGAFIAVDRPGQPAGSYLFLRTDNTAPSSPLVGLRAQFDTWRAANPCAAPPDAGVPAEDAAAEDARAEDAGERDAAAGRDATAQRDATADAGSAGDAAARVAGGSSCGCAATGAPGRGGWVWLLISAGGAAARSRRRSRR